MSLTVPHTARRADVAAGEEDAAARRRCRWTSRCARAARRASAASSMRSEHGVVEAGHEDVLDELAHHGPAGPVREQDADPLRMRLLSSAVVGVAVVRGAASPRDDTMHGPIGCSGVHPLPKSLHSNGRVTPRSTSPHWQPGISARLGRRDRHALERVVRARNCSRMPRPVPGMTPMPRHSASIGSNTSSIFATRRRVALRHARRACRRSRPPRGRRRSAWRASRCPAARRRARSR